MKKQHTIESIHLLKKGDNVRVYAKKTVFTKGYDPRFSRAVHKVLYITPDGKHTVNITTILFDRVELKFKK